MSHKAARIYLYKQQHGICSYCFNKVSFNDWTVDHIVPKAAGGVSNKTNYTGACRDCNRNKADMPMVMFICELAINR